MEHNPIPNSSKPAVASPCVRNCCLDDQDMCLGCFRLLAEITGWYAASEQEKQAILQALEARKQLYRATHSWYQR